MPGCVVDRFFVIGSARSQALWRRRGLRRCTTTLFMIRNSVVFAALDQAPRAALPCWLRPASPQTATIHRNLAGRLAARRCDRSSRRLPCRHRARRGGSALSDAGAHPDAEQVLVPSTRSALVLTKDAQADIVSDSCRLLPPKRLWRQGRPHDRGTGTFAASSTTPAFAWTTSPDAVPMPRRSGPRCSGALERRSDGFHDGLDDIAGSPVQRRRARYRRLPRPAGRRLDLRSAGIDARGHWLGGALGPGRSHHERPLVEKTIVGRRTYLRARRHPVLDLQDPGRRLLGACEQSSRRHARGDSFLDCVHHHVRVRADSGAEQSCASRSMGTTLHRRRALSEDSWASSSGRSSACASGWSVPGRSGQKDLRGRRMM